MKNGCVLFIFCLICSFQAYSQDLLWTSQFTGAGDNSPIGVVKDASNNIYVVGDFNGVVSQGAYTLTSYGNNDIFLAKYSSGGTLLWLKQIGSTALDISGGLGLSPDGNSVYVGGSFGLTCNFDAATLVSTGAQDVFLAKYNTSTGALIWTKCVAYGTAGTMQSGGNIAVDASDNVIMCGYFGTDITFIGGTTTFLAVGGVRNHYYAQFTSAGVLNWAKQVVPTSANTFFSTVRYSNTGYYFSGQFTGNLTLDLGVISSMGAARDMFLYKTDFSGNGQWVRKVSGPGEDWVKRHTVDANGYTYLTGYYNSAAGTLVIDSTATTTSVVPSTNAGNNDIFLAKYAPDGTLQWYKNYGTAGDDRGYTVFANTSSVVLGGYYSNSITFGSTTLTNAGSLDAFMVNLDVSGNVVYAKRGYGTALDITQTSTIDNNNCQIYAGDFTSPTMTIEGRVLTNAGALKDMFVAKFGKITLSFAVTNVVCNAGNTGAINLTVSGDGTAPYTYLWSNAATTEDLSGLTAGWYKVTVTDINGATKVDSAQVTQPTAITAAFVVTPTKCEASADGAINLTPAGGTGPYTFLWSNAAVTEDISALDHGWYLVTITDASACTKVDSAQVTHPAAINLSFASTSPSCVPGSDGTINLTVIGGTAPFTYLWSNTQITEDLAGLSAGTFDVTVTDFNLCTATGSYTLINPLAPTLSLFGTSPTCIPGSDGSIDLIVSGGTMPYTYLWDDAGASTTQDLAGLDAGTYNVTVTDFNSCSVTGTAVIIDPVSPSITLLGNNPTCNPGNDGSVDLIVTNGTLPFTYLWSNAAITEDITGLTAGTFDVTVTDAMGCTAAGTSSLVLPVQPSTTISGINPSCVPGNDGTIDLTVSGGNVPYTYLWTGGIVTEDMNALAAGTYDVTVTDAKNCTATNLFTLSASVAPSLAFDITNPTCVPGTDGTVNLTVTGGTAPFTYLWSNAAVTEDLAALISGTYDVTVTDAMGCVSTGSAILIDPMVPVLFVTGTNPTCVPGTDGTADLTVTGGQSPYTFLWTGGAITEDISGLIAGTYDVTVTDNLGCTATSTITLTASATPSLAFDITNPTCVPGTDGTVNLTVTGGTAPFTYLWSNAAVTEDLAALISGTYDVTVTDAMGCVSTGSAILIDPMVPVLFVTGTNPTCVPGTDGTADLTVTGGQSPYTFLWTGGAITEDISGLIAGTYDVTVTDNLGCIATSTITLTASATPSLAFDITNPTCVPGTDGTVNLTVTGGTAPFTFLWSNAAVTEDLAALISGTYDVTVTDAMGCVSTGSAILIDPMVPVLFVTGTNPTCAPGTDGTADLTVTGGQSPYTFLWTGGAITEDISGLIAGTYDVTVTDNLGCTATSTITLTASATPSLAFDITNPTCVPGTDGTVNLTVTGGTAPFTYLWSNAAITEDLTALISGTYDVTVTDAMGCVATGSAILIDPMVPVLFVTGTNPTCVPGTDGTADLTVTGGQSPYTFLWTGGAITEDINGLIAGTYDVTVTDALGCMAINSLTLFNSALPSVSLVGQNPSCVPGMDGSIDLIVTGGTSPYTYLWDDLALSTTEDIVGLPADTFHVTITDAMGCSVIDSIELTTPVGPAIIYDAINPSCNPGADGTIEIFAVGGTAPFTYLWSTIDSTSFIDSLVADTFFVTVTDYFGCVASDSIILYNPVPPQIVLNSVNPTCAVLPDGYINVTVVGGSAPFTFQWDDTDLSTTQNIDSLSGGTYHVTVTDLMGCVVTDSVVLYNAVSPQLHLVGSNPTCNPDSNGTVQVFVIGGVTPFIYDWSTADSTNFADSLTAGTFYVTVTDNLGCVVFDSISLYNPVPPALLLNGSNPGCAPGNDGSVQLTVVGGSSPFSFVWNDIDISTTQNIDSLPAGMYTVIVTDAFGCIATDSVMLYQPMPPELIINSTNPSCSLGNDGFIDLLITGGTQPIQYLWSNGEITQDIDSLVPDTFYVTVTDYLGCIVTDSIYLPMASAPIIVLTPHDPACTGDSTGYINLLVMGGEMPYTFKWDDHDSSITQNIDTLSAGLYSVTVSDNNGCSLTEVALLNNPEVLQVNVTQSDPGCPGNDGFIHLDVEGGTPLYTYLWSTGSISQDLDSLAAGGYSVIISDAHACSVSQSLTLVATVPDMTLKAEISQLSCKDRQDASITIIVDKGTAPFTYLWSNGGTTDVISGLAAGTYMLTVTDAKNCTLLDTMVIDRSIAACIEIFSAFSPNGDGVNDVWNIKEIALYPDCSIKIFDQWGLEVFKSNGYETPWDGSKGGKKLPAATYYYIIDLGNGDIPYTGSVVILR